MGLLCGECYQIVRCGVKPGRQVLQPARPVRGARTHELASGFRRGTDQPVELLRWRVARFVALRRLHCHGYSWSRWLLLVEIPADADDRVVSVPMPGMSMVTTSPSRRLNDSTGTMLVP
jgi:hypothetical protein